MDTYCEKAKKISKKWAGEKLFSDKIFWRGSIHFHIRCNLVKRNEEWQIVKPYVAWSRRRPIHVLEKNVP